ncbi:hypothetical protein H6F43_08835 [Leptolyngbya sp. FACHB-36]|uniref:hypothetical protein n=1 Tax=Leptolyngbya sp. FACHB-36 TaxID=2692808 RepID=UPI0016804102|nr:hypothetical protein [Leptolyngbya sp. FACHB-36]MBD2020290.1 hypothetical protein [Leptolyngbya sp. FACHB-36]
MRFIQHIGSSLRSGSLRLLMLAGVILLVWGTVSPVGTLVWWLNYAERLSLKKQQPPDERDRPSSTRSSIDCYIVFLPGVGEFSADQLAPAEHWFLDRLAKQHPNCVTVRDVFPYSAANKDLTGERLLAPMWRRAEGAKGWLKNADVLIKIRNLWRFAISADDRYGPVYNRGIADAVVDRMNAAQPLPRTQQPLKLVLIGTSGGAQVALGAASYLKQQLNAQIVVVSAGGVFDGTNGFDSVTHVYHLQGERDWIEDISQVVFASRWNWTVTSPFNQARQRGCYTSLSTGSHAHDGPEGYFGSAIAQPPNTTYVELTLQVVNQLPIWSTTPRSSNPCVAQ